MNVWPVSVDVGNALCKGVRGYAPGDRVVFPNLVASNRNGVLDDFVGFTAREPLIISMGAETWAVGHAAQDVSRTPRAQVGYARYDSADFPALVAGLLGEMYPRAGGTIALTFSLPVDGFGQAAEQVQHLSGRWEFDYKGKPRTFDLPAAEMIPVPEAFGSLCYFILSADGSRFTDRELAEGRVAIIDVGGYTTDVLTFRELDLTPVHGSVERGVLQVLADVNANIKRQFRRGDLERRDLEAIVQTGVYKHRGEPQDVSAIVEEAVWDLTRGVLALWTDPNGLASGVDYDAAIFTGGGWPIIRPHLQSAMQDQDVWHPNSIWPDDDVVHLANAIGAYRFAAFRRQFGAG